MRAKLILFIAGLLVLLIGIIPLLQNVAFMEPYLSWIPTNPLIFQIASIVIGAISIIVAVNREVD